VECVKEKSQDIPEVFGIEVEFGKALKDEAR
jgi:hypothetical protein